MARKVDDTAGPDFAVTLDERNNVASFGFDADTIAILFDGIAAIDAGGALELAEGFGQSFIAAT